MALEEDQSDTNLDKFKMIQLYPACCGDISVIGSTTL